MVTSFIVYEIKRYNYQNVLTCLKKRLGNLVITLSNLNPFAIFFTGMEFVRDLLEIFTTS